MRPFHDRNDRNLGGPHSQDNALGDINGGKMNGFIVQQTQARTGCEQLFNPACGRGASLGRPDVMGYHDGADIPNYWAYAKNFVLQDHMFQSDASWSLPSHLYMVSEWSARCRTPGDAMSCVNNDQSPGDPPDFQQHNLGIADPRTPSYAWTDLTYLLHKAGVSWGYYVFSGTEPDCEDDAALSCKPVSQRTEDAGHLEPAAVLQHRPAGQAALEHPVAPELLHAGEGREAAGRLLDRPERDRLRAPAGARHHRPDLRHRPDQRADAQPRLEQHRDLPRVG